jgi:hypothetical protein
MTDEERKAPTPEELKAAEERWQKIREDALVERYHYFQRLAFRLIVGEQPKPEPGHPVSYSYDELEVRHMAEMLFLLEVATERASFTRFRSRYAGTY